MEERSLGGRLVAGRGVVAKRHRAVLVAACAAGVAPPAACEPRLRVFGCGHEALVPFDPVNCQCLGALQRRKGAPAAAWRVTVVVSGDSVDLLGCSCCWHPSADEAGCA